MVHLRHGNGLSQSQLKMLDTGPDCTRVNQKTYTWARFEPESVKKKARHGPGLSQNHSKKLETGPLCARLTKPGIGPANSWSLLDNFFPISLWCNRCILDCIQHGQLNTSDCINENPWKWNRTMHNEKAFKKNVNIMKSTLRIKYAAVSFDPSGQTWNQWKEECYW